MQAGLILTEFQLVAICSHWKTNNRIIVKYRLQMTYTIPFQTSIPYFCLSK